MTTNKITQNLLESIKLLSDKSVSQSKAAMTIEAEITEIIDSGTGVYKVKYAGNILQVYAANPQLNYSVGDLVYILVPESDFTKAKSIIGLVKSNTRVSVDYSSIDDYVEVSDTLLSKDIYLLEIGLNSWEDNGTALVEKDYLGELSTTGFVNSFSSYLSNYRNFQLSVDIRTELNESQHLRGNYGLKLQLPLIRTELQTEEDWFRSAILTRFPGEYNSYDGSYTELAKSDTFTEEERNSIMSDMLTLRYSENNKYKQVAYYEEYVLDVPKMRGAPYELLTWTPQILNFSIPLGLEYDTTRSPRISVFKNSKINDDTSALSGFNIDSSIVKNDIFFRHLSIYAIDFLSESDRNGYFLTLKATEGPYFGGGFEETKKITPHLKVNGRDTNLGDAECYWFIENALINTTSDNYLALGGLGWELQNAKSVAYEAEDGLEKYKYVTNIYYHYIRKKDIFGSTLKVKCVIIIDGSVVSKELILHNMENEEKIKVSLDTTNGVKTFPPNTGDVTLKATVYYYAKPSNYNLSLTFQRYDKNGEYIDDLSSSGEWIQELLNVKDTASDWYNEKQSELDANYNLSSDERVYHNNLLKEEYRQKFGEEVGNQASVNAHTWTALFKFPVSAIIDLNSVICSSFVSFVNDDGEFKQYQIGSDKIVLTTGESQQYRLVIEGGDVLFKYDGDGDSPLVADYDGPLSSKITEEDIQPLTYRIFTPDGIELTEEEYKYVETKWYFPNDSLIVLGSGIIATVGPDNNRIVCNVDQINYTIANYYDSNKNNNTIRLEAIYGKNLLTDTVTPTFMKEGKNGSNGSKYAAIITCDGYGYQEKDERGRELKLKGYYDGSWHLILPQGNIQTFAQLNVKVYKDGELFKETVNGKFDDSSLSLVWDMFDIGMIDPLFRFENNLNGEVRIVESREWPADTELCQIVQAKITIANTNSEDSLINNGENLYAYYPIEIIKISAQDGSTMEFTEEKDYKSLLRVLPSIEKGFYQVLYGSNGINPSYNTSSPFTVVNDLECNTLYDYDWNWSSGLGATVLGEDLNKDNISLTPKTRYSDAKTNNNYIKVSMNKVQERMEEAKQSLLDKISDGKDVKDLYERIRTLLTNNSEDGGFLDKAQKISYTYSGQLRETINSLTKQFNYRNNIIKVINNILEIINNQYIILSKKQQNMIIPNSNNSSFSLGTDAILNNYIKDTICIPAKETIIEGKPWTSLISNMVVMDETNNIIGAISSSSYNDPTDYYATKELVDNLTVYVNHFNNLISSYYTSIPVISELPQQWTDLVSQYKEAFSADATLNNLLVNIQNIALESKNCLTLKDYEDKLKQIDNLLKPYWSNVGITQYDEKVTTYKNREQNLANTLADIETLEQISDIIIVRPLLLLLNRYELTHLADWDGNKLYVDEENSQYLFAPQIGAGIKEDNTFTGMTMGVRGFNKKENQHIGLFGYNQGEQTIFLNARDGSAILGKASSAQIVIDPTVEEENGTVKSDGKRALLYTTDFYWKFKDDGKPQSYLTSNEKSVKNIANWVEDDTVQKMLLTASVDDADRLKGIETVDTKRQEILREYARGMLIDLATPEIRYANGNFSVDKQGHLVARGGGNIAGWIIADDYLRGGNSVTGYTYLYSSNAHLGSALFATGEDDGKTQTVEKSIRFDINEKFRVYHDGAISIKGEDKKKTVFSVDQNGNLYSESGTIGGWVIKEDKLVSTDKLTTLYPNNKIEHKDDYAIKLQTKEENKKVRININDRLRIYSDGAIALEDEEGKTNFSVNDDGHIYSNYGLIGQWAVDENKLVSTDKETTLYADNSVKNTATFSLGDEDGTTEKKEKSTRFDVNKKFRVYSDGSISIGNGKFSVDENGNLLAKSGLIAGWIIQDDRLTSNDKMVTLMEDGTLYGGAEDLENAFWMITADGYAYFKNVEIVNDEDGFGGASRMKNKDGKLEPMGALFEWGPVKIWNSKVKDADPNKVYRMNAGEIAGWWFDSHQFTSNNREKGEENKPSIMLKSDGDDGTGEISGDKFTLTGGNIAKFDEGINVDNQVFVPIEIATEDGSYTVLGVQS